MTTKIVCRLLDAEGQLLGWVPHDAAIRGDGCLRANGPVAIPIDVDGIPAVVSLHWSDVNIEVRVAPTVTSVSAGSLLPIYATDAVMIKVGEMPGRLPPVSVRSVSIGIPVGRLGAVGQRVG